jgi:hypothetical protein
MREEPSLNGTTGLGILPTNNIGQVGYSGNYLLKA